MPSLRSRLLKLLAVLPAILLATFMNVFITSAVAGVVMIQLSAAGHNSVALWAAILVAVIVYSWLLFNHKLREYIKQETTPNE
jgi:hypothetical protein